MRIPTSAFPEYADRLADELVGKRLSKAVHYEASVIAFSLSNRGSLVFSVSGNFPKVYVSPSSFAVPSLNSSLATQLRKLCSNAKILSVTAENDDAILRLRLASINDVYQEERYSLIAELIPFKANLILLDDADNVLASLFTASLDSPRPLFRGLHYAYPENPNSKPSEPMHFDYETFLSACFKEEESLAEKRKKARFCSVFDFAKKRVKTLQNRLKAIENDVNEANKHINDGDYGTFIFTNLETLDASKGKMNYYGEEIALNENLSLVKNAENFFRRAKKAKAALVHAEQRRVAAIKELDEATRFLAVLSLSSEEDLERYEKTYSLSKKKDSSSLGEASLLPFECVCLGVRYVYGRNAKQNDFLGTLYSKKGELLWLHTKLGHGAHLVIDKENPSDKEIERGCEIALLASHQTMGEVMIAKKKDVKKGPSIGMAIVKTYTSAFIRSISKEAEEAFAESVRITL